MNCVGAVPIVLHTNRLHSTCKYSCPTCRFIVTVTMLNQFYIFFLKCVLTCWTVEFYIQWSLSRLSTVHRKVLRNVGPHSCAQTWSRAFDFGGVHWILHRNTEWTARDRLTSIVDVYIIISRSERYIFHTAATIFVVLARYFCL